MFIQRCILGILFILILCGTTYDMYAEHLQAKKLNTIIDCEITVVETNGEKHINMDERAALVKQEHEESN